MKITIYDETTAMFFDDLEIGETFIQNSKCYMKVEVDHEEMALDFETGIVSDIENFEECIPCRTELIARIEDK